MNSGKERYLEGGCDCNHIRYRVSGEPLIVHCCHCKWCQRETGSAFVINALFSSEHVTHLGAEPDIISTPSESGNGQKIARCPKCHVAVWSNYRGGGPLVRFVRVGTLDNPHEFAPDAHIYTQSKVPWVEIPKDKPAYEKFYDVGELWSKEMDERRWAMREEIREFAAAQEPRP
jgi:hypothetical protein